LHYTFIETSLSHLKCLLVLGVPARLLFVPVHVVKAERPSETRHDCVVFFDRSRRRCKNSLVVLDLARRVASMTTPASTRQEVTLLLGDWSNGDDGALEKLFPLVQPELHRLAHHYMSRERAGHNLQTTAILN